MTLPFIRITHADVVQLLLDEMKIYEKEPKFDEDLTSEHERWLVDVKFKKPVFVTRYPQKVKSFYMPLINETNEESRGIKHVDNFDLLVPETGELVGGSMRIHDYDELEQRINELSLDKKQLDFYIKLRENGTIPHGGWGMGFERFVKMVTGVPSVKDCVSFPFYIGCGTKDDSSIIKSDM